MRLKFPILCFIILILNGCAEPESTEVSIVETHDVNYSLSANRTFRGNIAHLAKRDTVLAYGFEWEGRYGSWKVKKAGKIKKGKFSLSDTTRLSKWTTFSVRAFLETSKGITYGNAVNFSTEGK